MRFSSKILVPLMVLALGGLVGIPHATAQTSGPDIFTMPDPAGAGIPAAQAAERLAQPVQRKPDAFGGNGQWTNIHASRFLPQLGAVPPTYVAGTGYVTPTDIGGAYFPSYWAQIDLPNGAEITDLYAWLYDNTANAYWKMTVVGYEANTPSFVMFSNTQLSSVAAPGYDFLYASFATNPLVRSYADLDGDGFNGDLAFTVNLIPQGTMGDFIDKLRFWGVCVYWHRTISPAPTTATFSDVPTNHWAFQFVEALAASGITAGCGGGKYCPDDPITRGQMAIYLAAALGLHWQT